MLGRAFSGMRGFFLRDTASLAEGGSRFASSMLSSTSSLSSPDDAASALPLRASSMVEVDVRPYEKLEASPRRISCRATSSSEMVLQAVGSGVGRMPPVDCLGGP